MANVLSKKPWDPVIGRLLVQIRSEHQRSAQFPKCLVGGRLGRGQAQSFAKRRAVEGARYLEALPQVQHKAREPNREHAEEP